MEIVISGNEKRNSLTPFKFSQPISLCYVCFWIFHHLKWYQVLVVQKVDSAYIHRINHYPADK